MLIKTIGTDKSVLRTPRILQYPSLKEYIKKIWMVQYFVRNDAHNLEVIV